MTARVVGNMREFTTALLKAQKSVPIAHERAINRALSWSRTRIAQWLAERKGLKVNAVRRRIKTRKLSRRYNRQRGEIGALFKAQALLAHSRLKPRQTKRGVVAGKYVRPHSFIQPSKYNKLSLVFHRVGKSRLPIATDKVDLMPEADRIATVVTSRAARPVFYAELERVLRLELQKRGAL